MIAEPYTSTDDLIGDYSKERLKDAETLMGSLIKLVAQANHFGQNPECPMCHCITEMRKYYEKWVDIEKFKKEHAECLEEFKRNPKKAFFS